MRTACFGCSDRPVQIPHNEPLQAARTQRAGTGNTRMDRRIEPNDGEPVMHATLPLMQDSDFPAIRRKRLETLQVNLGYKCNQSCVHCHVNAGPHRTEMMTRETINDVLAFMQAARISELDVTGGAPELNAHFRDLVRARARPWRARHGPLQPDHTRTTGPGRPRAISGRSPGRNGGVAAVLPRGKCRPSARQGRVRRQHPRPADASTRWVTGSRDRGSR